VWLVAGGKGVGGRPTAHSPQATGRRVGGRLHNQLSVPGPKFIIPEVIEPDEKLPRDLVALRKFAYIMDLALPIPGTKERIGLDGGLGFFPGIGDAIAALLSSWIIIGALRHRVPLFQVIRMLMNVLIDLAIGEVPILGGIFHVIFKENVTNLRLLMRYRDRGRPPRSFAGIGFAAVIVVAIIFAAAVAGIIVLILALVWIANQR